MTDRPAFPRGLTFGPLLQWLMSNGIGRERSDEPGMPGWTQKALALHLDRDVRVIRRWLADEVAISDDYLDLVIGELLGRPPFWPELAAELRAARDRTGRRLRGEPESSRRSRRSSRTSPTPTRSSSAARACWRSYAGCSRAGRRRRSRRRGRLDCHNRHGGRSLCHRPW